MLWYRNGRYSEICCKLGVPNLYFKFPPRVIKKPKQPPPTNKQTKKQQQLGRLGWGYNLAWMADRLRALRFQETRGNNFVPFIIITLLMKKEQWTMAKVRGGSFKHGKQ